jgi:arsenate reductase
MKNVLLLSAGNPCRAIVAEALCNKYIATREPINIIGAGMSDNGTINEYALDILEKEGIDTKKLKPKMLDEVMDKAYDLVVTLCDHSKEHCPVFPHSVSTIHMGFPVIEDDKAACEELFEKVKAKLIPLIRSELS